ncbi:MAG: transglutaminase domain-containing protein [Ignavibacteriae bacterium]|nr:transglutaminase domain-containing protein [Ignavibacteriota bacterium]
MNLPVSINFQVTRTGHRILDGDHKRPTTISPVSLKRLLSADRLVPIDGKISSEAKRVVQFPLPVLQKARVLYDHVVRTMHYDKTGVGWGRGDAVYACDTRRGNCTDFHSLFIGLARASGIPSRFVIGFPIPERITQGDIAGYHCWAEFYDDTLGWIPVDASEANKHLQKKEFYFGGVDANRVQFSVGRDIRLSASENVEPQNYFIYPYILVDGKPFDNVEFRIRFSDLTE